MSRSHSILALVTPFSLLSLAACSAMMPDSDDFDSSGDSTGSTNADSNDAFPDNWKTIAVDADGDGYDTTTDCDDSNSAVNPGATEADNLTDDDCDLWVDEDFVDVGDIVVTEVNRQSRFGGSVALTNGSWVEVYNTSARTVDMAYWVFARGTSASGNAINLDPASAPILAPGDYAVLCDTNDYEGSAAAYPLTCDYVWGDETQPSTYVSTYHNNPFYLRPTTDTVSMYINGTRTTGTQIDAVTWYYDSVNGYWPAAARYSMSLDASYFDGTLNNNKNAWCSTTSTAAGAVANNTAYRWYDTAGTSNDEHGTPGAANYNCLATVDVDGDGYTTATDCDDADAAINPAATELCDGIDQDCDGNLDNGFSTTTYYQDSDSDTYGNASAPIASCVMPSGYVADSTDCNDSSAISNPAGTEICDGLDNNCDSSIDEGITTGSNVFYADADSDTYGDAATTTLSCTAPSGYVSNATDCNDASAASYPGASETDDLADNDCDSWVDEDFVAVGDVIVSEVNRQSRFGGSVAVANGSWVEVYNDSSRTIDMANWVIARGTSASGNQVYLDAATAPVLAAGDYAVFCDTNDYELSLTAAWPLSCDYVWGDEAQAATYVGTNHDNTFYIRTTTDTFGLYINGNRTTGTKIDSVTWYYDAVNGYWPASARFSMSLDADYYDTVSNDTRTAWCSTSSNSAGTVSNSTTWRWYDTAATTNDEHGTPGSANYACLTTVDVDGDGYTNTTDCNDGDATINPGATEACNDVDDDCDTLVDEAGATGETVWYIDADVDGYGGSTTSGTSCDAPSGSVATSSDCNDADATINPGAAEVCNDLIDNDCDPGAPECEWNSSETTSDNFDFRAYGTVATTQSVGYSPTNNGDFNGDGFDDVAVGNPLYDTTITDAGRAYLWYGPVTTSDTPALADLTIDGETGTTSFEQFGATNRFVGDTDGDTIDDLMMSAYKYSTDRGRAYLFLGGTSPSSYSTAFASFTMPSTATSNSNYLGYALDGGDFDADGRSDIVATAFGRGTNAGTVAVWNATAIGGGAEDATTAATLLITGVATADYLGYSAAMVPDVDGDGRSDLVLGAPTTQTTSSAATGTGNAYVFYGLDALSGTVSASTADAVIAGGTLGDRFGISVAGLGDTDGDGSGDFAVTGDMQDGSATNAGAVYIFNSAVSGSVTSTTSAVSTIRGQVASDFCGRTVAGIGDVNADGFFDIMYGATGFDVSGGGGGGSGAGAIYIAYGPATAGTSGAGSYDARFVGANLSDAVGFAVSGGGDVNADGFDDFMSGAPSWDAFGLSNAGGSWLWYGKGY